MADRGENPHGEVDFVLRYQPSSVLDAGCGTGRVAIELARRGVDVAGTDLDGSMLTTAKGKAPKLKKSEVLLFARSAGGSASQVQLVNSNAQQPYSASSTNLVR